MLFSPDSFHNDWYGWVTNQAGHVLLGIVIAWLTGRVWPAVVLAVAFELAQWSPDVVDSVTDVFFTASGAVFQIYAGNGIMYALVVALAIGVAQRFKSGKR